ncbi:hypothetical protein AAC387_Pa05g3537 [Persea americana]
MALSKEIRINIRRGRGCLRDSTKFLLASPSFHCGQGALPSAGGHPADLTFLAVKQYKDDCCLVKQNSSSQLSECPRVPLRGIKFPLYCCGSLPAIGNDDSYGGTSCTVEEEQSLLDCLLLSQWEDRLWKGLLKYDVTNFH